MLFHLSVRISFSPVLVLSKQGLVGSFPYVVLHLAESGEWKPRESESRDRVDVPCG
jgi:hypothetical protein